jgi:hypothetical protein
MAASEQVGGRRESEQERSGIYRHIAVESSKSKGTEGAISAPTLFKRVHLARQRSNQYSICILCA